MMLLVRQCYQNNAIRTMLSEQCYQNNAIRTMNNAIRTMLSEQADRVAQRSDPYARLGARWPARRRETKTHFRTTCLFVNPPPRERTGFISSHTPASHRRA